MSSRIVITGAGGQLGSCLAARVAGQSREVLALVLETYGFAIESAADGQEALELLARTEALPEVILMDTQMPGLSGVGLVEALGKCCDARIVAISGSAVDDSIRQATDGFLLKPIEAADLMALLRASGGIDESSTGARTGTEAGAGFEGDGGVLIDPVVLGKLRAMMPAASVREIYAAVAADLKTRLVTLKKAMDAGEVPEVARIAT